MSPAAWALALAVLGSVLITGVVSIGGGGLIPYRDPAFADYDHNSYLAIARDGVGAPGKASAPPFCWRILTPLLARALHLPLPGAFFLLSFTFVAASTLAIWALLRQSGFPHEWSLAGEVAFLSFFWAAGFNLWNYMLVDPLSTLLVILGLIVLEKESWTVARRQALLALLMLLAALNKETWVLTAATALVYFWLRSSGGILRRTLAAGALIIPAAVVAVLVRQAITPDFSQVTEFPNYDLAAIGRHMIVERLKTLPRWGAELIFDPWSPLVLVPLLLAPVAGFRWLLRYPHRLALLVVAAAQTFFGTSVGRLVIAAVPVAILFSMEAVRDRLRDRERWAVAFAWLMALQFLFQYLRRTTMGLGVPPYNPHPLVTAAYVVRIAAFAVFAAIWIRLRRPPATEA